MSRVRVSAWCLLWATLVFPALANEELPEDIALLEFLGTIAGLENMGVEVDSLITGELDLAAVTTDTAIEETNDD